jgi:predicted dehydrogenase
MSTDNRLKCGVAGVGYLGQHHARIYNELPQCELVGIHDTDEDRAREIADQQGCLVFGSLEELANSCDAASVVVPTDHHRDVAVPLLEAGCHLLVEKPICNGLEEAAEILDAANRGDCIVQVGHIEHYNPVMAFLEERVTAPRYITADRLAPFNPRGTEVGVVLDLMIHDIGVILQLVRSPMIDIRSIGVSVLSGLEDIANARLEFESGCVANLNVSRVSEKKVREIRVFQSNNYLSLDFMNQKGHLLLRDDLALHREEIPIEKGEPLKLELLHFADCVLNREAPKVGGAFGMRALEIAIQITEQIRAAEHKASQS